MILPVKIVTNQDIYLLYDANESLICSVANYEYSERIRDALNGGDVKESKQIITLWCNGVYLGDWKGRTPISGDTIIFDEERYRVAQRALFSDRIAITMVNISKTLYEVKEVETND